MEGYLDKKKKVVLLILHDHRGHGTVRAREGNSKVLRAQHGEGTRGAGKVKKRLGLRTQSHAMQRVASWSHAYCYRSLWQSIKWAPYYDCYGRAIRCYDNYEIS